MPAIFRFGPRKMELPKFTANCAKSAQFAHCHRKSRKIHAICINFPRFSVPTSKIAKISGNLRFGQITQILPAIFRFGPQKMELPKFTVNCTKSAQFTHCHHKSCKIRTICVNFPRFSVLTSKIAKISGNSRFGQITQISLAIFRFGPQKMELPKFTANCLKSAQFAHCHRKSCKIRAICVNFPRFSVPTSKIAKISGNSRFGQITQISPAIF